MNSLILGSGYGIYVYLPAIYKVSKYIYLNEDYKITFSKRKNLKKFKNKIIWYSDNFQKLSKIDNLIIAKRPKDQLKIIKKLDFKNQGIKRLFLEKPIAQNPINSLKIVNFLEKKKINFNLGFLFKFLKWYQFFKNKKKFTKNYQIIWSIKINQKNKPWKLNKQNGGGILRFYGIHFIRFLYENNFTKVKSKIINKEIFSITSQLNNKFEIKFKLHFSNKNKFLIKSDDKLLYNSPNPFLKEIKKYSDPRIKITSKYFINALKTYKTNYKHEKNFILFWKSIENEN